MQRLFFAAVLLLRFTKALIVSGLQTVLIILQSGRAAGPPAAALVRVRFAPMSEWGAALLGSMVSLTPGTTTIDIDMENRELLLHVLDATDIDGMVAGIRQDFEPGLRALFGQESQP